MNVLELSSVEANLRYTFTCRDLLEKALRHSSFVNEHPDDDLEDNERLEFLGDAILSAVVSHLLMNRFPELSEGDLSKIRSNLVNEARLAEIAEKINLGAFIRLGKGEKQSNGHAKKSILADGLEALLAAVYMDGGFNKVFEVIDFHFSGLFDEVAVPEKNQDFKSQFQELVQATIKSEIEYHVISESGPDHDKTFMVELIVGDIRTQGTGKNIKAAEQEAAQKALELLTAKE
jgi:ribonuclease III